MGFLAKWRKGEAELRTGLLFAAAGMLGAPVGLWIAGQMPETWLMLLFAGLMLTIAWKMWKKAGHGSIQSQVCIPIEKSMHQPVDYAHDGPSCQRDVSGQLILTSRCARLLTGWTERALAGSIGQPSAFTLGTAANLFGCNSSRGSIRDLQKSFAGVIASTVFTLFVIPVSYWLLKEKRS